MIQTSYNPDVLSCLANLSNDEVFTPPNLANQILDLLPNSIWSDKNATFLDPVSKSGVFLREIAKRLMLGLETQIPDKRTRINHIYQNQLYGIAITELTSLLSRRSVYCSKTANGKYSICETFDTPEGNIKFDRVQHAWQNGKCSFCGASQDVYDRSDALETYAYQFIHTDQPEKIFQHMKFDVIVGNPPYQLGSDGGTRDMPIYNKFVEQAKKLNPRFLCMIIPSRWMAGGLGLSEFRKVMLADKRIRKLVDFPVANEAFAGVEIKGGVCYFLWERDNPGSCDVITNRGGDFIGPIERELGEFDVFVRDSRAVSILKKILAFEEKSIIDILSVDKEFGWTSNFSDFSKTKKEGSVPIYHISKGRRSIGWIERQKITKSVNLIDKWKVLITKAYGAGEGIPHQILGQSIIASSPSVCTQSYLFFFVESKKEAESLSSYIYTRFFRFLVSLRKITQDATRSTYTWVPVQSWDENWTDEKLYAKYGITTEEIAFIESMIRPMDGGKPEENEQ